MTKAAIAAQVHQALDAHGHFATQVTLDDESANAIAQLIHVGFGEILDLHRTGDTRLIADFLGTGAADAKNGSQRDLDVLVVRDVNPSDTGHLGYTPKSETLNCNPG